MLSKILLLFFLATCAFAEEKDLISQAVERHAKLLAEGQAGDIRVDSGPIDLSRLAACSKVETYTPPNTRTIGRTHIGVRCTESANWNILVPVHISVRAAYLTTSRALSAGQTIHSDDLKVSFGDISSLPTGTISRTDQAEGKILRNSIGPGQVLRSEQLQSPYVIQQGQSVKVLSLGPGFSVKASGKALNNAAEGDLARVRMQSGKTVSGIAQHDGTILLKN